MPCQNNNLWREIQLLKQKVKDQNITRQCAIKKGTKKIKFGLKSIVMSLDPEFQNVQIYKKLMTEASTTKKGKLVEGFWTRELFRCMKDLNYGGLALWHKPYDGYSPEDQQTRNAFRDFIMNDPIMRRVLA